MTDALPKTAAVIGCGRFGLLWAEMLRDDFELVVHDPDPARVAQARFIGLSSVDLREALGAEVIFYCVPISAFEAAIRDHVPHLAELERAPTIVDVLSVKVHARTVLDRHLPQRYPAMLTHPMFGPDSVAAAGIAGQTIVLDRYRMAAAPFDAWARYFEAKGLTVVEMPADQHDRLAAESQGVTHFVGRTLERFGFAPTPIDTLGARMLHEITAQVCNDSWQLFVELQTYNPHTRALRLRLSTAQDAVFDTLLPTRIVTDRLVVGIQGGRGSFNEAAARHYLSRMPGQAFELVHFHTTEAVLRALHEGSVDRGQFAMHNAVGGMVEESVRAMAQYRFAIVDEFAIKIAHALMIRSDADFAKVDTVMTHPQVLAQCRSTMAARYPSLRLVSGDGDLIDPAKVAELLGSGALPASTATMGSNILAEHHNLRVVDDNLQDLDENLTSFLWVQRPG